MDAVQAGEAVTLTVHGEPVADIVSHGRRPRWPQGTHAADAPSQGLNPPRPACSDTDGPSQCEGTRATGQVSTEAGTYLRPGVV